MLERIAQRDGIEGIVIADDKGMANFAAGGDGGGLCTL